MSAHFSKIMSMGTTGCFDNGSSGKTTLIITGVLAAIAALTLVVILPVYFNVIEPHAMSTESPADITTMKTDTTDQTVIPTTRREPFTTTTSDPIRPSERVDCLPEENGTRETCEERGCAWSESEDPLAPSCYFTGSKLYIVSSTTTGNDGIASTLLRNEDKALNHYGQNFPKLTVTTTYISKTTVRIKVSPDEKRYEIPMDHPTGGGKPRAPLYKVQHTEDNGAFGVKVTRRKTSKALFDTSFGELMFSDQFIQISTRVASEYVYGFGEHMRDRFKHEMNWKSYGMFSRDQRVESGKNLYGVHPYFLCVEEDGSVHGVYFANSNAMDVTLQPTPAVTYRTTGGLIDFYVFLGPSMEEVTAQYTAIIGHPMLPPYWSLGFQLSRWGYNSLNNLSRVVNRNLNADIPYEVQYSDIDYMERGLDFTIDQKSYSGLEDYVRHLKDVNKMRYIMILDPAISGNETEHYPPFNNGIRDNVFIKSGTGDLAWGKVWPILPGIIVDPSQDFKYRIKHYAAFTAYPDFFHPNCTKWWSDLITDFHQKIEFDGLWIDMNEPSSFVNGSPGGCSLGPNYENSPYHPKLASENLYDKTICMSSKQYNPRTGESTDHYNSHSLYGWSQSLPTMQACRKATGERCMVLSRSTFPGSGKYAGHWLGDNRSSWNHLAASIIGMLEFNLFGIPYVGADVCGFFEDATYELCLRWMQLGAFYPFYRNHNVVGASDQDPAYFGDNFISDIKGAMNTRYALLPYLYTLFYEAYLTGATVIRPLMSVFPRDNATYGIDRQFMWGNGILITPVLEPSVTKVEGYFPGGSRWFDFYSGQELQEIGGNLTLDAPIDRINLHIRGGSIIPTQKPAKTTYYSRKNNFGLVVALDGEGKAEGKLFWDDGTSIDTVPERLYTEIQFSCEKHMLKTKVIHSHDVGNMTLGDIRILGVRDSVTRVRVNGDVKKHNFLDETNQITIANLDLDLNIRFEIRWEMSDEWNRIDCAPSLSDRPNRVTCQQRGCVWIPSIDTTNDVPSCFFPHGNMGSFSVPSYNVTSHEETEDFARYELSYNAKSFSLYGTPFKKLDAHMEYQTDNRFHFKITDSERKSFEIPKEILNLSSTVSSSKDRALYEVEVVGNPFSLKVSRKSTGKTIFDSSIGPLIFEERFLQISSSLPSENVFGFGEHNHMRYRHDLHWRRWGMFARDIIPVGDVNSYGHQTFFMAIDDADSGSAVGVYFHNSNAMDVMLQPNPAVTYRTTGGVLDFYIFLADSQEALVQEYHQLVGFPAMPPYWGLGFQLSRWGYGSLDRVKEVVNEMRDAKLPFDVQYGDIDYMDEAKDFTYDQVNYAGLPDFIDQLHDWGMRYVIILDPGIKIEDGYEPYDTGVRSNVFVMDKDGVQPAVSRVWPGLTHHIDYTHPNTSDWWYTECEKFYREERIKFDALWVDMDEPSNFQNLSPLDVRGTNCSIEFNKPPYMPKILWHRTGLHSRTLCMENQQYLGKHYDLHSLYGHTMASVTQETLKKIMPHKRSFVFTRSTFSGTGRYGGHWLGDNQSLWSAMAWAITGMVEFNLFGVPYVGADVCGFMFDATAELCQRWMQVGAFYPFSRNHNANGRKPQHPTAFGPEVTASSKKVLEIRYSILPYMYTLHHRANHHGGTVVRALVHEFASDLNTWDVNGQFLLGEGFLVTPVLEKGARRVTGYFPSASRWFDFHTGIELEKRGHFVSLDAPLDHINLHVRGGVVIPMQDPAVTTTLSRNNPMSLLVALDEAEKAFGELYWDDGEARTVGEKYVAIHFTCSASKLALMIHHRPVDFDVSSVRFKSITVVGLTAESIESVNVQENSSGESSGDGEQAGFRYEKSILVVSGLSLRIDQPHVISWSS